MLIEINFPLKSACIIIIIIIHHQEYLDDIIIYTPLTIRLLHRHTITHTHT